MYSLFIYIILGDFGSIFLSVLAFFLMLLCLAQCLFNIDSFTIKKEVRKNRLIMRAINWGIFGGVFLLFGEVIIFKDLETWRATARVALFFLMIPEIAYHITILWPIIKKELRKTWTKVSCRSLFQ